MAVSTDPLAASLTWSKQDPVNHLSSSGLMGEGYPHPDLASISGSNPTLLFSIPLKHWLMVYHEWGGSLAWSTSENLDRWTKPCYFDSLLAHGSLTYNYPILIGSISDTLTTKQTNNLYYAQFPNSTSTNRSMVPQQIQLSSAQSPVIRSIVAPLQAPAPGPALTYGPAQAPLPASLPMP